jgi:hypothetical protein
MEDVDEPRCSVEAADDILRTLENCGFCWDGAVLVQSNRKTIGRSGLSLRLHPARTLRLGARIRWRGDLSGYMP